MMKRELKICLPVYKIVYSVCYLVILSVIQGVAYIDEIGGALDANIALLAVVFCAETYVMERSGKRTEIIGLYPRKRKAHMVFRRMAVQTVYLCAGVSGISGQPFRCPEERIQGENRLLPGKNQPVGAPEKENAAAFRRNEAAGRTDSGSAE